MQLAKLQKTTANSGKQPINTEMKTDITKNKHGGNAQSNAAFEGIKETLTERQNQVLGAIEILDRYSGKGATLHDVTNWLRLEANKISGRITQLKAMGKIKQIGRRDGCAVYVISEP